MYYHKIVLFTILLPYIGIGIMPSDIQPFAVIFSFISIIITTSSNKNIKTSIYQIPFIILSLISIVYCLAYIMIGEHDIIDVTRSLFSYVTPVIISLYTYNNYNKIKNKIINVCDIVMFITIIGYILNILGLTNIIQLFVSRSVFIDITESARGLTSFYPEQSRISEQMTFIFMLYVMYNALNKYRIITIIIISILSFAGQLFVQVGIILIAYSMILLIRAIKYNKIKKTYIGILGIVILILINITNIKNIAIENRLPTRGIIALESFMHNGTKAFANDDGIIIKSSGFFYAISSLVEYPFNFKFLSKSDDGMEYAINERVFKIQNTVFNNERPYVSERVNSALGIYIVDYGIFGLLMAIIIIYYLIKSVLDKKDKKYLWAALVLIIMLFIKLPLTNPSLWFLYSIIIINRYR